MNERGWIDMNICSITAPACFNKYDEKHSLFKYELQLQELTNKKIAENEWKKDVKSYGLERKVIK